MMMMQMNTPCCVAVQLCPASMDALALQLRGMMPPPAYFIPIVDYPVKLPAPLLSVAMQPIDAPRWYAYCAPSLADAPGTSDAVDHISSGTPAATMTPALRPAAHEDGVQRDVPVALIHRPPTMNPTVPPPHPLTNSEPPSPVAVVNCNTNKNKTPAPVSSPTPTEDGDPPMPVDDYRVNDVPPPPRRQRTTSLGLHPPPHTTSPDS
jgi:hypothetical protein